MSKIVHVTTLHKSVQTAQDLEIVKQTLHDKLSPSLFNSMRPYERMTFSPDGIEYDKQFCTWYYIEHISKQFGIKDKNKGLVRDWKGPVLNVGVEIISIALVMNVQPAILNCDFGQQSNNTLLKK